MASREYTDLGLYRRLVDQARPYWLHVCILFAVDLLATPLALLTPLPLMIVVDAVLGGQSLPRVIHLPLPDSWVQSKTGLLLFAAGMTVAVALANHLQGLASSLLRMYTGAKLVRGFRAQMFRHVQRLSLSYHDQRGTADSLYRIQNDASAIQSLTIDGTLPFLTALATVVAMLYVTLRIDWQLAVIGMSVSPVLLVLWGTFRRRLRAHWHELKQVESTTHSVLQEVLGAVRVVKAFAQEDREQERYVRHANAGIRAQLRLTMLEGKFGILLGLTLALGGAAALFLGARHVQAGALELGQLTVVLGYLSQLYSPLKTMSKKAGDLQSHLAGIERAFALLDQTPDVVERPGARPVVRAAGAVAFRSVSFGYGPDRPVLRDITFDISPGTCLGIAGTTGAGKTTLVNLLTRFYDPTVGQILLDGLDLRDYRLADLRNQFAIVLQEPVLFSTSIAENIAYARPEATEEEIVQAATMDNVHDFIASLPDGYDTQVGDRGMQLSGGERQRIALARAFLKNAPLLILDEPTSSVDMRTEAAIVEAMERLMSGRTTFIIAHRLCTLKHCDSVLKIERGRLVENLSPAALASGEIIGTSDVHLPSAAG